MLRSCHPWFITFRPESPTQPTWEHGVSPGVWSRIVTHVFFVRNGGKEWMLPGYQLPALLPQIERFWNQIVDGNPSWSFDLFGFENKHQNIKTYQSINYNLKTFQTSKLFRFFNALRTWTPNRPWSHASELPRRWPQCFFVMTDICWL